VELLLINARQVLVRIAAAAKVRHLSLDPESQLPSLYHQPKTSLSFAATAFHSPPLATSNPNQSQLISAMKYSFGIAALAALATASDVHDLTKDTFDGFVKENDLVLAECRSPCHYAYQ
jgi:hypothetical protein